MPGNPLVRFDEGRVGRTARCRLLSYSTGQNVFPALTEATPDRGHRLSCSYSCLFVCIRGPLSLRHLRERHPNA